MSGVGKGRQAVIEVLRQELCRTSEPCLAADELPALATKILNAWSLASNPVGKTETIYDDFYRLRAVTRAVLWGWDNAGSPNYQADAIEALRAVLISLDSTPTP